MLRLPLLVAVVALVAPFAGAHHGGGYRTDEQLGTALVSGPATVAVDPGGAAGDRNPRLILPGTQELRARVTVVDAAGNGVAGVAVTGRLESSDGGRVHDFVWESLSPGVYQSGNAAAYHGGAVVLRVTYEFPPRDGVVDHVARWVYRPAAPSG